MNVALPDLARGVRGRRLRDRLDDHQQLSALRQPAPARRARRRPAQSAARLFRRLSVFTAASLASARAVSSTALFAARTRQGSARRCCRQHRSRSSRRASGARSGRERSATRTQRRRRRRTEVADWRAIFFINLPVAAGVALIGRNVVPADPRAPLGGTVQLLLGRTARRLNPARETTGLDEPRSSGPCRSGDSLRQGGAEAPRGASAALARQSWSPAVADIIGARRACTVGDDLLGVDALQVDAGRAEVGVAELALDDVERHAFAGELDGVRVAQLMRREPPPDARLDGEPTQLDPDPGARPGPPASRAVDDAEQRPDRQLDPCARARATAAPSPRRPCRSRADGHPCRGARAATRAADRGRARPARAPPGCAARRARARRSAPAGERRGGRRASGASPR